MVMWMKATEVAASSASQVRGMLSTYPEKSGWCLLSRCGGLFPFWVVLSADDSRSPASLEAAVSEAFGDATANGRQILPVRSTFQVQIEPFDVPIVAASKNFKASSSRWAPISSCKLIVFICEQRWWL